MSDKPLIKLRLTPECTASLVVAECEDELCCLVRYDTDLLLLALRVTGDPGELTYREIIQRLIISANEKRPGLVRLYDIGVLTLDPIDTQSRFLKLDDLPLFLVTTYQPNKPNAIVMAIADVDDELDEPQPVEETARCSYYFHSWSPLLPSVPDASFWTLGRTFAAIVYANAPADATDSFMVIPILNTQTSNVEVFDV